MPNQFHYKNNRLQQLRGFCYTMKAGSLSKAAEKMQLSHSAISLQIKSLERDLEMPLFKRKENKLIPTSAARIFYSLAIPHVQGMEELYENFKKQMKEEKSKIINIAANNVSISYILPRYIKKFEQKNPEAEFKIKNLPQKDALQRLMNNEIDMMIYCQTPEHKPDEVEFISIVDYQPILLTNKNHPLARKKKVKIEDIKKYELLRLDKQFVTIPNFDEITKAHDLKTKIDFEMANYENLKNFVKNGVGIAILSNICLEGEQQKELVSKDLSNYFPLINYGIFTKKGREFCGAVADFIDMLKTEKLLESHKKKGFFAIK